MFHLGANGPDRIPVIVFDHIRKCAGTTVAEAFQDTGMPCFKIYTATAQLDVAEHLNTGKPKGPIFLYGHHAYGIHEHLAPRFAVHTFTFVRPPLDIARSFFRYLGLRCRHLRGTFTDFLADRECNLMTDHLGGELDRAIARLHGYFFVGFVNAYHRSIETLGRILGLSLDPGRVFNKSARPGMAQDAPLPETFVPGGDDFALYAHCLRHFPLPPEVRPAPPPPERLPESAYYPAVAAHIQAARLCDADAVRQHLETGPFDRDLVQVASCQLKLPIPVRHFQALLREDADEAILSLDPGSIDTQDRYAPLLAVAERLAARAIADSPSWVTRQAQHVLGYLAATPYAASQGTSPALIEKAQRLGNRDFTALVRRVCWLRNHGRAEAALALIEAAGDSCYPRLRTREYLTTLHVARGEDALRAFVRNNRDRLEGLPRGHRPPPMPHHLGADRLDRLGTGPILIVRSAPLFVFNDLVDWISAAVPDVHLLIQENVAVAGRHGHLPALRVPVGMFNPHGEFPDRSRLLHAGFASILYPVSDFSFLDSLSNFLLFFGQTPPHRSFAYFMHQTLREPRDKTLLPIAPEPPRPDDQ